VKTVIYAGDSFVTGDAIADAVLRYSKVLAEAGAADTVTIPVLTGDGAREEATLLIGPSSQIVAETTDGDDEQIADAALVDDLNARAAAHEVPTGLPVEAPTPAWDDEI